MYHIGKDLDDGRLYTAVAYHDVLGVVFYVGHFFAYFLGEALAKALLTLFVLFDDTPDVLFGKGKYNDFVYQNLLSMSSMAVSKSST